MSCYVINNHIHEVHIIELHSSVDSTIVIEPLETICIVDTLKFTLSCLKCRIYNYPGTTCSVTPNENIPNYYCINDYTIDETHWLCPCFSCYWDPTYLEIIPAGNRSRAISVYF